MTSIEKRAHQYGCKAAGGWYKGGMEGVVYEAHRDAYIEIATEQRKIDINKACEAYRKELQEIISLFNRLGKQFGVEELGKTIALEASIKDFRKTLEEDV